MEAQKEYFHDRFLKIFSHIFWNKITMTLSIRPIAKKVFFILFGIFLSLSILELGLRLTSSCLYAIEDFRARQNRAEIETKDAIRILCLGACYTVGVGVKPEYSYPSCLQRILNRHFPQASFVVINGALRGKNLSYFSSHIEKLVKRYRPDIIIFNVSDHEDLENKNILLAAKDMFSLWGRVKINFEILMNKSKLYQITKLFIDPESRKIEDRLPEEILLNRPLEMDGFYATKIHGYYKKLNKKTSSFSTLVNLSRSLAKQGLFEEAARFMEKALENGSSKNWSYYRDLFGYYIAFGEYPEAFKTQKKLLSLNPSAVTAILKKIEDINKKLERNPSAVENFLFLSDLYALLGEYGKAAEIVQKNLPVLPRCIDYFARLDFYNAVLRTVRDGTYLGNGGNKANSGKAEYFYRLMAKPWPFIALVRDFKWADSKGVSLDGYQLFSKLMSYNLQQIIKSAQKHNFVFILENMTTAFDQIMTVREASAQLNVPLIDVYDAFQKVSNQDGLFHPRQILRLSENGNKVLAEAIYEGLVAHGLLSAVKIFSSQMAPESSRPILGKGNVVQGGEWNRTFFSKIGPKDWVAITPDWKMIVGEKEYRLYRYREDLLQEHDLVAKNPEVIYELMQKLRAWREAYVAKEDNKLQMTTEMKDILIKEGYW